MRLDLKVTHTPDTKSKRPWETIQWLGSQPDDIIVRAKQRLKVFCLSDKSFKKKKISKLQSHLSKLLCTNLSTNGEFITGILETGSLLIWWKERDVLKTIKCPPDIAVFFLKEQTQTDGGQKLNIFISNDASKILLVIGCNHIFLWIADQSLSVFLAKASEVSGSWSVIGKEIAPVASSGRKEAVVHARFFTDSVLGSCCCCTVAFYKDGHLQLSSLMLRWLEPWQHFNNSYSSYHASWHSMSIPLETIAPFSQPVPHGGALVLHLMNHGPNLAIAVNQRSPHLNKVVFASVHTQTIIVVDLKSCGCKSVKPNPEIARSYWISSIAWMHDDLFLACMTRRGTICILTRLGEPLLIQTDGCSVVHEPDFFIPLHPLITVVPSKQRNVLAIDGETLSPTSSLLESADEGRQHFTAAFHPCLPMLLCSDGYMATVMEFPSNLTCTNLMREFLSEGKSALNVLREQPSVRVQPMRTLVLEDSPQIGEIRVGTSPDKHGSSPFLDTCSSEDLSFGGPYANLSGGKIVFGSPYDKSTLSNNISTRSNSESLNPIVCKAERMFLQSWLCGSSSVGPRSSRLDALLIYTAKGIAKLCLTILKLDLRDEQTLEPVGLKMTKLLQILRMSFVSLQWDSLHGNTMCSALKLVHRTITNLLSLQSLLTLSNLACCIRILLHAEQSLNQVYNMFVTLEPSFSLRSELVAHFSDGRESHFISGGKTNVSSNNNNNTSPVFISPMKGSRQEGKKARKYDGKPTKHVTVRSISANTGMEACFSRSLLPTWKFLYQKASTLYLAYMKYLGTISDPGDSVLWKQRSILIDIICALQAKLRGLGYQVPIHVDQYWIQTLHKAYLKGCELYVKGHQKEAISCWKLAFQQSLNNPHRGVEHTTSSKHKGNRLGSSTQVRGGSEQVQLQQRCLLAILYSYLEQYQLGAALQYVNSLITCHNVEGKLLKLKRSFKNLLESKTSVLVPSICHPTCREVVISMARFMALYFTNQPLAIFPPSHAQSMPVLFDKEPSQGPSSRTIPIYQDHVANNVRQQGLSDVWTADVALNLMLICGLFPEAVWFAQQLGDWKSAFTLSVVYSDGCLRRADKSHLSAHKELILPDDLLPHKLLRDDLKTWVHTPLMDSHIKKVSRSSSFTTPSTNTLNVVTIKKSASSASLQDESKTSTEQLTQILREIFSAATISGLDPIPGLLGNLMEECLLEVSEFSPVVHERFYLPAPPYYCPQPDYIPNENDPPEVLEENQRRRKINDLIQMMLVILQASHCSLPCARWYTEQLYHVRTWAYKRKKVAESKLPTALAAHAVYTLDFLEGCNSTHDLPPGIKFILQCFRDMCCLIWFLQARDRLSLALRDYNAAKEKLNHAVKVDVKKRSEKVTKCLREIIEWAEALLPFGNLLRMEEEVQDILLTAISELDLTKEAVTYLANSFYNEGVIPSLLEEKFQRLKTKLRKKKVYQESRSKKESAQDGKAGLRCISLLVYFKFQSKRRGMVLRNMAKVFGNLEEQVFVSHQPSEKAAEPEKELESVSLLTKVDNMSMTMLGYSFGDNNSISTQSEKMEKHGIDETDQSPFAERFTYDPETVQYPRVGSREFEATSSYLEFLETFYLITIGKLLQVNPHQADTPLIAGFSRDICERELGLKLRKVAKKNYADTELNLNQYIELIEEEQESLEDYDGHEQASEETLNMNVATVGLFEQSFVTYMANDVADMQGWKMSEGFMGLLEQASQFDSRYIKTDLSMSEDSFLGLFVDNELSKPNVVFGKGYSLLHKLVNWMIAWSVKGVAKHNSGHLAVPDSSRDEKVAPRSVMRVHPPNMLVVLGLWLLQKQFYTTVFSPVAVDWRQTCLERSSSTTVKGNDYQDTNGTSEQESKKSSVNVPIISVVDKSQKQKADKKSKRKLPEVKPENIPEPNSRVATPPVGIPIVISRRAELSRQTTLSVAIDQSRVTSPIRVLPHEPDVPPVSPKMSPNLGKNHLQKKLFSDYPNSDTDSESVNSEDNPKGGRRSRKKESKRTLPREPDVAPVSARNSPDILGKGHIYQRSFSTPELGLREQLMMGHVRQQKFEESETDSVVSEQSLQSYPESLKERSKVEIRIKETSPDRGHILLEESHEYSKERRRGHFTERSNVRQTKGGVVRDNVYLYVDSDNSSVDMSSMEEDEDEDENNLHPPLSNRKLGRLRDRSPSPYDSQDKQKIPTVVEDTMGITVSSQSSSSSTGRKRRAKSEDLTKPSVKSSQTQTRPLTFSDNVHPSAYIQNSSDLQDGRRQEDVFVLGGPEMPHHNGTCNNDGPGNVWVHGQSHLHSRLDPRDQGIHANIPRPILFEDQNNYKPTMDFNMNHERDPRTTSHHNLPFRSRFLQPPHLLMPPPARPLLQSDAPSYSAASQPPRQFFPLLTIPKGEGRLFVPRPTFQQHYSFPPANYPQPSYPRLQVPPPVHAWSSSFQPVPHQFKEPPSVKRTPIQLLRIEPERQHPVVPIPPPPAKQPQPSSYANQPHSYSNKYANENSNIKIPLLHLETQEKRQQFLLKSKKGGIKFVDMVPPDELIAFEQQRYDAELAHLKEQEQIRIQRGQHFKSNKQPVRKGDAGTDRLVQQSPNDAKRSFLRGLPEQGGSYEEEDFDAFEDELHTSDESQEEEEAVESKRKDGIEAQGAALSSSLPRTQDKEEPQELSESPAPHPNVDDGEDPGLGKGYAMPFGSCDDVLHDRDARPPYPTSAEAHYRAVMNMHPQKQDAVTMATETTDVATSMETNGLLQRLPDVEQETSAPQASKAEMMYTALTTGLSAAGKIIAPDIFFGLRFGSGNKEPQTEEHTKKEEVKQSKRGHSFLNVVDIGADLVKSIFSSEQKQPSASETKPTDDKNATEKEPHPKDDAPQQAPSQGASKATNAELHYKALFLRDADGKGPLEEEAIQNDFTAGPDKVTSELLEGSNVQAHLIPSVNKPDRVTARSNSKEKMEKQLKQMGDRLGAIEETSKNMEEDFKNTKLLLHTVEKVADAMAPSLPQDRSRPSYSLDDYKDPKVHFEDDTKKEAPGDDEDTRIKESESDGKKEGSERTDEVDMPDIERSDSPVSGRDPPHSNDILPTNETLGQDSTLFKDASLGLSGFSGVSDIIAELIAAGEVDVHEFGISEQQQKAARQKVQQSRKAASDLDLLESHNLTTLTKDQLREIFTPSPRQDEDIEPIPASAAPDKRSKEERDDLKQWMDHKKTKQLNDYKRKREVQIENERVPYKPMKSGESKIYSSLKQITKAEDQREQKKKVRETDHHHERLKEARALMSEIFSDIPQLPPKKAPPVVAPKPKKSKPSTQDWSLTNQRGQSIERERETNQDNRMMTKGTLQDSTRISDIRKQFERRSSTEVPFRDISGMQGSRKGHRDPMKRTTESQRLSNPQTIPKLRLNDTRETPYFSDIGSENLSEVGGSLYDRKNEDRGGTVMGKTYKAKPYTDVVRLQRPEKTRKRTPMKAKTYAEMLQELQMQASGQQSKKAQQHLYGSRRVPGTQERNRRGPRTAKTYTERLRNMKKTASSGYPTRLQPKTSGHMVPKINTGTIDLSSRRQAVERRGITPEPTPRSSTPYTDRMATHSNTGTHRGDGVVSPFPTPVMRSRGPAHQPVPYVERLKEVAADAPKARHKDVYALHPSATYTYKAPQLRTPSPRIRPYTRPSADLDTLEETSDLSDLSPWSISDDVRKILYQDDNSTIGEERSDWSDVDNYNDYVSAVNIRELEDIASVGSGSALSIDWEAVDQLISTVK